jgi:signal transduction histidine kinase
MSRHTGISHIVMLAFLVTLILLGYAALSGYAWSILTLSDFLFWLILLTFILAATAGSVATYSFASFARTRETRSFMLIIVGFDLVIWVFLYLVTHPASMSWASIFSDRNRNRTIGTVFVIIIVPAILIDSLSGGARLTRKSGILLSVWGFCIVPLISFWFLFSPSPVFSMTSPQGGIEGLTPEGAVISLGYLVSQIVAAILFVRRWWGARSIHDLSLLLALSYWIIGTLFIVVLWNPYQIAELIWVATIISGLAFIAAVQFMSSILEPHRKLEALVEQRSQELELSYRESEYYLNMWTHKMGNLLQGIVTYLEILESTPEGGVEQLRSRNIAHELSKEAILVNKQVLQLSQIKEIYHSELKPVSLYQAVTYAVETAYGLLDEDSFNASLITLRDASVRADELLSLVFLSAIIFHVQNKKGNPVHIDFSLKESPDAVSLTTRATGEQLSKQVREYLLSDELIGSLSLNLELFIIKVLMKRYDASLNCAYDTQSGQNICTYRFKL